MSLKAFVVVAVKFLNRLLDGGRVGHDLLHILADGERQFVHTIGVQRFREGHLHGVAEHRHRHAFIHLGRGGGNGFQRFRGKLVVPEGHHLGSDVIGLELELRVHVHDAEIREDLPHGLRVPGGLLLHFLELEVVNHALFFDQGQQGAGNVVGHIRTLGRVTCAAGSGRGSPWPAPVPVPAVSAGW